MYKKLSLFALVFILLTGQCFAGSGIRIEIDQKPLQLEVEPIIENGRTMVPFRAIFEALGLEVDWNENLKIATAYNDDTSVSIKMGANYGSINGELKSLEANAKIVQGRVLVPLRFVSEAFGNEVVWNAKQKLVSIKSGFKPYQYTENLPLVGSKDNLKLILDYAGKFHSPVYRIMEGQEDTAPAPAPGVAELKTNGGEGNDFSTTNVQVAGVDEADVVKTNGDYIYHLRNKDLRISKIGAAIDKTAPTGKIEQISKINIDTKMVPQEFYLNNNLLVIIAQENMIKPYTKSSHERMIMPPMDYSNKTILLFYNVSKPENPTLIRRYDTDGIYMTSRLTDGKMYLVTNKMLNTYKLTDDNTLPKFYDSIGGQNSKIGYDQIRYFPDSVESNLMITLGFDLNQMNQAPDKKAYLGSGNSLYANSENLYVSFTRYQYHIARDKEYPVYNEKTDVYRFALKGTNIQFAAKGSVPGRMINQFSMDENKGYFRIATTTEDFWNAESSKNNLYVLDASLNLKGRLEGLAPGEKIYSTRFIGDRAYMVTFRQVDPFYVIDLQNPSSPSILGYLKIPGFSEYLHPYDNNTIIGFGKETVETANGVRTSGLKIGMFDVTDVTSPVEKDRVVLGGQGSYSEVLNNHKALLFSKTKNIFALPVTLYDVRNGMSQFVFQGAYVYSIENGKFVLKGTSTHLTDAEVGDATKGYNTEKNVERIVYVNNWLYTLSNYGIKTHALDTMSQVDYSVYP